MGPRSMPCTPRARRASAVAEPYLLAVLDPEHATLRVREPDDTGGDLRDPRAECAEARLRAWRIDGDDRPRAAVTGGPAAHLDLRGIADDRDVVGLREEVRATIERIDLLGVVEADPPQHLLDGLGLLAELADQRADIGRQQLRVDRIVGEQGVDELLVVLRDAIGFLVRQP